MNCNNTETTKKYYNQRVTKNSGRNMILYDSLFDCRSKKIERMIGATKTWTKMEKGDEDTMQKGMVFKIWNMTKNTATSMT